MGNESRASVVNKVREIAEQDGRYSIDSYLFLFEALAFAQAKFRKKTHVRGKELLEGIKELALERFGPMSKSVFEHWGVKATDDFGEIVFLLVKNGLLGKTSDDKKGDFHAIYSFDDVFVKDYKYGTKV